MSSKQLKVGGEVDAWCTSCRADRAHRIVAMVAGKPEKVECLSCSKQHRFHAPKTAAAVAGITPVRRGKSSSSSSSASVAPPRASRSAAAREHAHRRDDDLLARWEKAIAGRAVESFRSYRMTETFVVGELMRHSKFGEGFVTAVLEPHKIEVLFRDGARLLAMAMSA